MILVVDTCRNIEELPPSMIKGQLADDVERRS